MQNGKVPSEKEIEKIEGEDLGGGLKIIGVNRTTIKEMNITSSSNNGQFASSNNTTKTDLFKEYSNEMTNREKDNFSSSMPKNNENVPL
jgi:hypothetical protein